MYERNELFRSVFDPALSPHDWEVARVMECTMVISKMRQKHCQMVWRSNLRSYSIQHSSWSFAKQVIDTLSLRHALEKCVYALKWCVRLFSKEELSRRTQISAQISQKNCVYTRFVHFRPHLFFSASCQIHIKSQNRCSLQRYKLVCDFLVKYRWKLVPWCENTTKFK